MEKPIKNILFIIPPFFPTHDLAAKEHTSQQPVFTIPYGVLSLAAYIKEYSRFDVRMQVMDLNLAAFQLSCASRGIEEGLRQLIREKMQNFCPDIVGISALFNTCYDHLELISIEVNAVDENALLIIGGGLGTNLYREILNNFSLIDACCYGEGEIPFCQLVDADDHHQQICSHPSWVTRESLQTGRVPQHTFVQDLDNIPFFDYELIDLNNYTGRSLDKSYSQKSLREISIHTSRGCPFNCVFCSNATIHGKKIRFMSVEKVIAEIELAVKRYSVKVLLIEDDHFLSDKQRAKMILERTREFNLKIEFPNGIAVYAIDEEVGELLRKAGVTTISLAVESGSDFMLHEIINKPLKVSMIKPAVEILKKNGISVHAFIVIGIPGELETHRDETMRMLYDVGFDWIKFFLAIPVAGSRLYDICKEKGYLVDTNFSHYVTTKANIRTPDIDPEYIEDKVYMMNLEANFIYNYNMRIMNFRKAVITFENIVQRYPEHAFAHYCLAKNYEGLGWNTQLVQHHLNRALEIISTDAIWARYAQHFGLFPEKFAGGEGVRGQNC